MQFTISLKVKYHHEIQTGIDIGLYQISKSQLLVLASMTTTVQIFIPAWYLI
jgi:hypothetical protein